MRNYNKIDLKRFWIYLNQNQSNTTMANAEVVVGMDLGTTYSCIAVWLNGKVEIVPNDQGNRTTPSVVSFTDTERLVGDAAKNAAALNPTNTVFDAKRLIGRKFSDVQDDIKHWPFKVVCGSGDKPLIEVTYKGEIKRFSPEEISSMVIQYMVSCASSYLGKPVKNLVITVPAYFNDSQRQATKDAAVISGANVLRIINEPTASSLCYGLDKNDSKDRNVLVFDFGGGTHDVSLLTISEGFFSVLATAGITRLGGEDIDNCLVDYCAQDFKKRYQKDLATNPRALRRLRTACERAKRTLSSSTEAIIEVESLFDGQDFMTKITRAKFEDLCMHIFRQTLEPVDRVLRDAKMDKKSVDEIVLVGGSTRIPKVQQLLSEYFGGRELNKSINPDEAVAFGACIQSAIIAGIRDEKLNNLVMIDVTPLSLGVETVGAQMTVLIPRNTTIPTKKSQLFSTFSDSQTTITVKVYEGERARTRDNNLLGTFDLAGIPPMPRGMPKIEITYDLDANGILSVTAVEKSTGKSNNVTIKNDKGRLSEQEINRLVEESERMKADDLKFKETIEAKNGLEGFVYSVKNSLNDETISSKMTSSDKETLNGLIGEMQKWLDEHPNVDTEEYKSKQKEFESHVHPIMMKLYANSGDGPQNTSGGPSVSSGSNKGPTVEEVD